MAYATIDQDGNIEHVVPTIEDAVESAASDGARHVIIDAAGINERQDNPKWGAEDAVKALRLKPRGRTLFIPESALSMSNREAMDRLAPIMTTRKARAPAEFIRRAMLGENAKTKKKDGHAEDVWVKGVNLVPYWKYAEDFLGQKRRLPNLCVGSSEACRHSCLVFAGQNWAASDAISSKYNRTNALFSDPEAFGAALYNGAKMHVSSAKKKGFVPMVRLNVLSDVPWEEVFPSLFSALPELQFYDYTKVTQRSPPMNYDLTFSASGTNLPYVQQALDEGRRVAAVVYIPGWRSGSPIRGVSLGTKEGRRVHAEARHRLWASRLPPSCGPYEVIDGDVNDVRPLDPAPAVVALRWKDPGGQAAHMRHEGLAISKRTRFVVEVQELCGLYMGAVTPPQQPDSGVHELLSERGANPRISASKRSNSPRGLSALKRRLIS